MLTLRGLVLVRANFTLNQMLYSLSLTDLTIAPDMLTLAEHILDSKASKFDPATFRDR
jgi:non-homologous end joining protein Ku